MPLSGPECLPTKSTFTEPLPVYRYLVPYLRTLKRLTKKEDTRARVKTRGKSF